MSEGAAEDRLTLAMGSRKDKKMGAGVTVSNLNCQEACQLAFPFPLLCSPTPDSESPNFQLQTHSPTLGQTPQTPVCPLLYLPMHP